MEREIDFEVGDRMLMSQIIPEKNNKEKERKRDMELADIIYIFYSKDQPGIKFYDRSPIGSVAKLTGSLPEGVFLTDIYSISEAIWDEKVNAESHLEKVINGFSKVRTIMVTKKIFTEISQKILNAENPLSIKIDTRTLIKYNDMTYSDFKDFDNTINDNYDDILKKENINVISDDDVGNYNFKL